MISARRGVVVLVLALGSLFAGGAGALLGVCGPFTDVAGDAFCPFVLEIFYLGITTGTSPTTYDPTSAVNRLQMAAFLSRSVDGVLKRGSRRAALGQFWATQNASVLGLTATVGIDPQLLGSDGADIWVANGGGTVARVRASDKRFLETWTGATAAFGILVVPGGILVSGDATPGALYMIDPGEAAGAVTTVASNMGALSRGIAFDGARVWTANKSGSVSIITPGPVIPWTVTTVTAGFAVTEGAIYDGANIWVTNEFEGTLLRLDAGGAILQTVTVGMGALYPAFDGNNIWVPTYAPNAVSVVRASTGAVLRTLTGNGLSSPATAAFDGQRVLVASFGDSVSLWKAADLTPLGSISTGTGSTPVGAASDGINFWIALYGRDKLARF